jgi:CheY-like chemotaxis protein
MKPTILAVDDSKAIRFLLQTIFSKRYQIVTAADTVSAMYWLSKKNYPDLIISESTLPDTADWEFIANLKSSVLYKDIPLIVVSSAGQAEADAQCRKYGLDHFFSKPFKPAEILELVNGMFYNTEKIY